LHGHSHPHIAQAIARQAETLEQVIFAEFTHPQAERLADRLAAKTRLERVFFSDNG
jgi:adenosylmethionine-8-amino-7-oxononanoate aminotransferase